MHHNTKPLFEDMHVCCFHQQSSYGTTYGAYSEICCHCGAHRMRYPGVPEGHGPYYPRDNTWIPYTPFSGGTTSGSGTSWTFAECAKDCQHLNDGRCTCGPTITRAQP
jgi:hypothetical protein